MRLVAIFGDLTTSPRPVQGALPMPCVLAVASSLAASPYPRVAFSQAALLSGESTGPNVRIESAELLTGFPRPYPTANITATPTPSATSPQCGVSTSMSFCNASYPIVLGDLDWLQYVDAQARYFFETEQRKRGPLASSTCLDVMKSMVCSRRALRENSMLAHCSTPGC